MTDRYEEEILDPNDDDGTMPGNVECLRQEIVGRRIVSVITEEVEQSSGWLPTTITLDNGKRVQLINTNDCCAHTELQEFLLHPKLVNHMIMGVGTTNGYTSWHIYADAGDILKLTVGWSAGNPFYYGYGFTITVTDGDVPSKEWERMQRSLIALASTDEETL